MDDFNYNDYSDPDIGDRGNSIADIVYDSDVYDFGYGDTFDPSTLNWDEINKQAFDVIGLGNATPESSKLIDDILKAGNDPAAVQEIVNKADPSLGAALKSLLFNAGGGLSLAGMAALGLGAYGLSNSSLTRPSGGVAGASGYQGTVPSYTAVRKEVEQPEYVPYSGKPVMGRRYFTDTQYIGSADTEGIEAAKNKADTQAGILANYTPKIGEMKTTNPESTTASAKVMSPEEMMTQQRGIVATENYPSQETPTKILASGGVAALKDGRYLKGGTDGMADKIPSSIDNKQPAKLSHGEFVIPADVVSHLGNGNSDAGAKVLYDMMAKVRKARTGNKKQGKQINPSKFVPGGIVGYNSGGAVAFQAGGAASSGTTSAVGDAVKTLTTSTNPTVSSNSLSEWVGPTVTDMLARGKAIASEPYKAYTGPLTAGESPLQSSAFTTAGGIAGDTFDANAAAKYMNPYIQTALMPQLDEMRRQSQINMQQLGGMFGGKGALGGARNQIAQSEGIRNLLDKQTGAIGSAYSSAFDKAMGQYNTEQNQQIADLKAMLDAGAAQRQIEQEGITASKAQFEEERQDPFTKLLFEQSLLKGLPLGTTTTGQELSDLQRFGQSVGQVGALYDIVSSIFGPKK